MITRIIDFALDQRFVTLALVLLLVALGVAAFHLMEEALAFTLRRRLVTLALTALTACGSLVEMPAPSPDGPRISDLAFDPAGDDCGLPGDDALSIRDERRPNHGRSGAMVRRAGQETDDRWVTAGRRDVWGQAFR